MKTDLLALMGRPALSRILIDMDGVVADWISYMLRYHFHWLTIEELNKHPDRDRMISDVYRDDPCIFLKLSPLPGALDLVRGCIDLVGEENVGWLTATGTWHKDRSMVATHKREWIAKHIDAHLGTSTATRATVVLNSSDKPTAVDNIEGTILVDDYQRNCKQWMGAGGMAVCYNGAVDDARATVDAIQHLIAVSVC